MSGTFLCPNVCGFAKVVALEIGKEVQNSIKKKECESVKDYRNHVKEEQYKRFNNSFSETCGKFDIDITKFHKNLLHLKSKVRKWNLRKSAEKSEYLNTFSIESWNNLPMARKREHSLANCRGCAVRYANVQSYSPVQSRFLIAKANPVFAAEIEAEKLKGTGPVVKPLQADIRNTAKKIYNNVAPAFEKKVGTNLADAFAKVPELNLQHTSRDDRRKGKRNQFKQAKENIEKQMEETAFLRYCT